MYGHLRIHSPWTQLGIFLGLLGGCYVIYGLIMAVILQVNGIPLLNFDKLDWNDPRLLSIIKLLQGISSVIIFFLPAFLYAVFTFNGRYFYFLGLKKSQRLNTYVLAVMCVLLAFPLVFWLGQLNQGLPLPDWMTSLERDAARQMEAFLKVRNSSDVIINIFIIALLPSICEELCFRGALQRIIIQLVRNPWAGILVTAFLFSALHLQFEGFIPRMFLGIVLGAFYWYSGSLWPSILAHFVNNAVQVLVVSYMPQYASKNPDAPAYVALVSAIAVIAILYFCHKQSKSSFANVYETDELNRQNQFLA